MKQEQLDLLIRVQAGEPGAFEELYEEYYFVVFYFALKLCRSDADAKDITQETFIRVEKSIGDLREIEAFKTWLYRITVSRSNMLFRKRKDLLYEDGFLSSSSYEEAQIEYIPHKYVAETQDREIVQRLISQLSQKRSTVLYLFYFEQLSLEEISKVLDISIGTVKTRLFEGRKALKVKVVEFEKAEGRKVTFQFGGGLSVLLLCAMGYIQQVLSKQKYVQVIQVSSIVVCVASATTAVVKTSELFAQPVVTEEVATKNEPESIMPNQSFSPISYKDQEITSNKEAYFALLDFASDTTELETKTKEEALAIKGVVDLFLQSEHAYRSQLEATGWLVLYQSLL